MIPAVQGANWLDALHFWLGACYLIPSKQSRGEMQATEQKCLRTSISTWDKTKMIGWLHRATQKLVQSSKLHAC